MPDIIGVRANKAIIGALLKNMRRPSGQTRDDKKRRKKRRRHAHKMISGGAVKIKIGK